MWWSCFFWYEKGPWHIWEPESLAEKAVSKKDLAVQNAARKASNKAKWDAIQVVHRLHATRAQTGTRAQWQHTELTGKIIWKDGQGGIDWYRHQLKILKPKLIPFIKLLLKKYRFVKVQEDNTTLYACYYNIDF